MLRASEVARFLDGTLLGSDLDIAQPSPAHSATPGSLVFLREGASKDSVRRLNEVTDVLAIVDPGSKDSVACSRVVVDNPRLAFSRVLREFFAATTEPGVAPTARVSESAQVGDDVAIGEFCVIGDGVVIGAGSRIAHHVVITRGCQIGERCQIHSHVVIGEDGYGFEADDEGGQVRMPHLAAVTIGDDVEIGSGTVIARGALENTFIGAGTKIDAQVFIAHNVRIGTNCMVIAGAEVSGSVVLGNNVWVAPQATILNQVTIGDNAMIGIGAVVIRPVAAGAVVAGNPARELHKRD